MWIVLDNNQAQGAAVKRACGALQPKGWTIPPLVLAELWLRPDGGAPTWLDELPHRVGLETAPIMEQLARLDAAGIAQLSPFGPHPDAFSIEVLRRSPAADAVARDIKEENRRFVTHLDTCAKQVRALLATVDGFVRFDSWTAIESSFALGAESFLGSLVVESVRHAGARQVAVDPETLFTAVMNNAYLGRFYRAVLAYCVCVSGGLDQGAFRRSGVDFAPGPTDDWTDLSLFLYAAPGDKILSADRRVASLARIIDPLGAVEVLAA